MFDERKPELDKEISTFEERFEPYIDGERYMTTTDREYLIEKSHEMRVELADLARELKLHVIPDDDADWLSQRTTRFSHLADHLPDYNAAFVEREREEYASLFTTDHGPLNDQQQKAIVRNDRRNLVDASAGTGKTLTLTYRFLYLLEKGVAADDIAAVTYTRDAAAEMKARIAAAADGVEEHELNISTIHTFANGIVGNAMESSIDDDCDPGDARETLVDSFVTAALSGIGPDEADIEQSEAYTDFRQAIGEFQRIDAEKGYVENAKRRNESVGTFLCRKFDTFVRKARTFGMVPESVRANLTETDAVQSSFGNAGASLLAAYHELVATADGPADFKDMILSATDLVEAHPDEYAAQYDHILVDEFQDVSDTTLEFVESFMHGEPETHLFCVGDDWQSIFGFTGSNVRHFTGYEDEFDDVTYTQLAINYRCPSAVTEAGAALMDESAAPQNEKTVRAQSDIETTPKLHTIDSFYDERVAASVADLVERAIAEGHDYDDVMLLSRNDEKSTYLNDVRDELAARDVPHERPDPQRDYLPAGYIDSLDDVTFDASGNAVYDGNSGENAPPMVTAQSVHASKGTEAPVVILVHAVDDDHDGIPIEERTDDLLEPAMDITADHIPEERRLFYVALTRCEEEFHAVAEAGHVSRYVEDIEDHFERVSDTITGVCTGIRTSDPGSNQPVKATLDCDGFEATLIAWPESDYPILDEGAVYTVHDPFVQDDGYGEEIRMDRSEIERVDTTESASVVRTND